MRCEPLTRHGRGTVVGIGACQWVGSFAGGGRGRAQATCRLARLDRIQLTMHHHSSELPWLTQRRLLTSPSVYGLLAVTPVGSLTLR